MHNVGRGILALLLVASLGSCAFLTPTSASATFGPPKYLFDALVFEIWANERTAPDPGALDRFRSELARLRIVPAEKITTSTSRAASKFGPIWNYHSVQIYEHTNREVFDGDPSDRKGVVFISYLDGLYLKGDSFSIAGICYGPDSFALLPDVIPAGSEHEVLLHEFLHLLNIPLDPSRQDEHGHCPDDSCVMHWKLARHPKTLCPSCRSDLWLLRVFLRPKPGAKRWGPY